jgi:hypothetical protein
MTNEFRDVAAILFAFSIATIVLVVFYFGIQELVHKIADMKTISKYKQEAEADKAAYRAQVEELKRTSQSTELHV